MKYITKYLLQSLSTPRKIGWTTECNAQIDNIEVFPVRSQYVNFDNFRCFICNALRDLVSFVQFKKREKHP